jgi:hypothetical protein
MPIVLCLSWLLAVAAGLFGMAKYERTPGSAARTPRHWPTGTGIALDGSRATLLMFAHPKCPCTRASIGELNRLLARCRGQVSPRILFFTPDNAAAEWTQTSLWPSAQAIPGVIVESDPGGKRAKQFGAETSGHVVLYNAGGELLFQGGITAGRGHAGDNSGESSVVALLSAQNASTQKTPVFGCALLNPSVFAPATPLCTKP